MNILITGASGLLGYAVVQKLSLNNNLFLITKDKNHNLTNSKNIHYIYCDLSTKFSYVNFPTNIDTIIHLSQSPLYKDFPQSSENIFDINIQSTQRLLDYGLKANLKHFIFTSSGSVYEPYINLKENDYLNPLSYYANSKLIGERLVKSYESYFDVSIFRLFFLYGPHPQNKQTLINSLITKIKNQETITLDGNSSGLIFTPTLTLDIANFLDLYLNSNKHGLYNIANPKSISLLDVVSSLSKNLNLELNLQYNHDKKPIQIIPNLDLMQKDFPMFEYHSFEESLKYMINTNLEPIL